MFQKMIKSSIFFSLFLIGLGFTSLTQAQVNFQGSTPPSTNNGIAVGAGPYRAGDSVMVKWKGSWWPAQVVQVGAKKWYIHYDGYSNSWDEWVGPSRIRPR